MNQEFAVIDNGERWPSGDYIPIAVLPIIPDDLAYRLGTDLNSGEEDGLGPWVGKGIRLASGDLVEFLYYKHSPELKGIEVRVDKAAQAKNVLGEVLMLLNIEESELVWMSEFVKDY